MSANLAVRQRLRNMRCLMRLKFLQKFIHLAIYTVADKK
ncbi:hypothetical protein AEST_03290 [Alishewanella aestuarii B11]|uniref:Uncharacterized protein n=1 Tax=Alishewanella aestuarii B11 TaxID=1197174 RepID=J1Q6G6_9ALTE|nr:hypothetical protein AEST_03290 [Alishewanella aestuarii B11]